MIEIDMSCSSTTSEWLTWCTSLFLVCINRSWPQNCGYSCHGIPSNKIHYDNHNKNRSYQGSEHSQTAVYISTKSLRFMRPGNSTCLPPCLKPRTTWSYRTGGGFFICALFTVTFLHSALPFVHTSYPLLWNLFESSVLSSVHSIPSLSSSIFPERESPSHHSASDGGPFTNMFSDDNNKKQKTLVRGNGPAKKKGTKIFTWKRTSPPRSILCWQEPTWSVDGA